MGWSSGSAVMGDITIGLKKIIKSQKQRIAIYKIIIGALEMQDWDNQSECLKQDKAFDIALKELHPNWEI